MDRAEQLKLEGNQCFQKGKFRAAIDMYTEAIVLAPGRSVYYSNRALCYARLQKWEDCRDECQNALRIDALNAKASYMLGTSYMHLRAFEAALEALHMARSSAQKTQKPQSFQNAIRTEIQRVKKSQWHHHQQQRRARHEQVKHQLRDLFAAQETAQKRPEARALREYVDHMTAWFEKEMYPGTIPDYFLCPINMEIMQDPVTTPNGISYERHCLEQHLQHNGSIDPLTRKQLTHTHTLVLIRHGESEWNRKNLFTGCYDVELSEKGNKEAAAAGQLLKQEGYRFDVAYTSYLKRAIHTLWHVLEQTGQMWIPVHKTWRLDERHYGALTGLDKQATVEKHGAEKAGKNVVIAAHGNSLRALVKHLDNISEDEITGLNIPTGAPIVYHLDENLKPIPHKDAIKPLSDFYLGVQDEIRARILGVKNQTK
ncbi:hypothetical protein PsorP6_010559 [Peronosclerospora sorghi]|uniref:Uncharacterized protein n=1 Tax=Peronosclerospora sorghi TaxID=230839 RepID=A0ACC0VVU0_9STRA|nr:hypothetical protein PsorP6_010559 [Peronosclerospora sorghi]